MIDLIKIPFGGAEEIYSALEKHFIYEERRDFADFQVAMKNPDYTIYDLYRDGAKVGYAGIWRLKGVYYLEHFAIYEQYRNAGVGSECIDEITKKFSPLVLEVEPPVGEMESRRIRFYERHGFCRNGFAYLQPSYHHGEPLPLQLMSYPAPLSDDSVIDSLYPAVYSTEREKVFSGQVLLSDLRLSDDLGTVARLIYQTDPYIFPYLYKQFDDRTEKILVSMIKRDTIYHYRNIKVAKWNGRIVGMIVWKRAPIAISKREMELCFTENGVTPDEDFERVYAEYYHLLQEEPQGIYIANVCVLPSERDKKVGRKMLERFLEYGETYHLETVKANTAAFRLYSSLGFTVDYEYPGFTAVPCYRMSRN